jgi:hypothetical protein
MCRRYRRLESCACVCVMCAFSKKTKRIAGFLLNRQFQASMTVLTLVIPNESWPGFWVGGGDATSRIHADRALGGDRDHRRTERAFVTGGTIGSRSREENSMRQQNLLLSVTGPAPARTFW